MQTLPATTNHQAKGTEDIRISGFRELLWHIGIERAHEPARGRRVER